MPIARKGSFIQATTTRAGNTVAWAVRATHRAVSVSLAEGPKGFVKPQKGGSKEVGASTYPMPTRRNETGKW